NDEVVRPDHVAGGRQGVAQGRVVRLQLHDVAGPGHACGDVAGGQPLAVLVAGEALELPAVLDLGQLPDGGVEIVIGELSRVLAHRKQGEPDRVAHLGEQGDL